MSLRYVKIPDPVEVLNEAGAVIQRASLEWLWGVLIHNPVWAKGYAGAKAQGSITDAFATAKKTEANHLILSEEAWQALKQAVERPMHLGPDGREREGFGIQPVSIISRLLPLMKAIVDADSSPPADPVPAPQTA